MTPLQQKLWLLQHLSNPIWAARLAAEGELSQKYRRALLGARDPAFAKWLREPTAPRPDSLGKVISHLDKNFGRKVERAAFSDAVTVEEFWANFSDDLDLFQQLLDELHFSTNPDLVPHLRMMDHEIASQVFLSIKGKHSVERILGDDHSTVEVVVRFVHKLQDGSSIISAELAVPRQDAPPFLYRGIVSELIDSQALYWVFSSVEKRHKDLVFMITDSPRHKAWVDVMRGGYLTVRDDKDALPAMFEIRADHLDSNNLARAGKA